MAVRKKRQQSPQVLRRRTRIFESARLLFTERGFDGVGLREIAEHAGVSKALIGKHYQSKERLREAVDAYVMERFEQLLLLILGPEFEARELRSTAAERAERYTVNRDELLPLLKYLRHSLLENSRAGHAMFQRYLEGLGRLLRVDGARGQQKEELLWLQLAMMSMQLGPIMLEGPITALTGRSPFHPDSIKARATVFSLLELKLREVRDALS